MSKVVHRAPVPHGPGMQPPRPGMPPPGSVRARQCMRQGAGAIGCTPAKPRPIGPHAGPIDPPNRPPLDRGRFTNQPAPLNRQTIQQTARGIDPPGQQNRAKRAANRAACNGPGSVRKPPNQGKYVSAY